MKQALPEAEDEALPALDEHAYQQPDDRQQMLPFHWYVQKAMKHVRRLERNLAYRELRGLNEIAKK